MQLNVLANASFLLQLSLPASSTANMVVLLINASNMAMVCLILFPAIQNIFIATPEMIRTLDSLVRGKSLIDWGVFFQNASFLWHHSCMHVFKILKLLIILQMPRELIHVWARARIKYVRTLLLQSQHSHYQLQMLDAWRLWNFMHTYFTIIHSQK